jgi:anti-sigma B factor antagonist
MKLKISTREIDGVRIVDCYGRIIFGEEAAELRQTVKQFLMEARPVVLNLRDVTVLDSSGAGTLVSLNVSAQTNHKRLKLANLSPRVRDVLAITRLLSVFEIYGSEYDAVASFADNSLKAG